MIIKVKKIKNLGIFHDYTSTANTPSFKRFNLVYGWNGSGKTTLSRLFCAFESGELEKFPTLEYKFETDTGATFKHKAPFTESKVMVFNQDYIHENAPSLDDPNAKTKHIYLLGKEDKELGKQIETDKEELVKLKEDTDPQNQGSSANQKKLLDDTRGTLFKSTADTIAAIKGGTPIRNYNRNNAMRVYDKLENKEELAAKDLAATHKVVEQQVLEDVSELLVPTVNVPDGDTTKTYSIKEFLDKLDTSTSQTLQETVQQTLISRLKDNEDIADWVAQGMAIHASHKSTKCEYCDQEIPSTRLDELAKHFNEAYSKLISKINAQIKSLELVKGRVSQLVLVDKANLYSQFQESYQAEKEAFDNERTQLIKKIDVAISDLEGKKMKTHESASASTKIDATTLTKHLTASNKAIQDHNAHTKSFKSTVDAAREKLEKHYVSGIYEQVKKIDEELVGLGKKIEEAETRISVLSKKIDAAEAAIRNSKEACEDINKCLVGILGRDELVFEDQEEGYTIKRNGVVAANLSEGEKTAIAFAYFVIHLNNKDFDFKKGIVVIDDPISSLDIEGIFRVCTLMDTKLKKAKQIIILTHNFDFFNQLKKWFMNDPDINNKPKEEENQGAFLMVKTHYDSVSKQRVAYIDEIDPLLKDYESEYHYLFKKLLDFDKDTVETQGTIEAVYPYPNVARKVMECFLSFRIPTRGNLYTRMLAMQKINKAISATDIKEVYNFINSNSHLDTKTGLIQFDPALGANGKKYVDQALKLIKDCDEQHYKDMTKLVGEEV